MNDARRRKVEAGLVVAAAAVLTHSPVPSPAEGYRHSCERRLVGSGSGWQPVTPVGPGIQSQSVTHTASDEVLGSSQQEPTIPRG